MNIVANRIQDGDHRFLLYLDTGCLRVEIDRTGLELNGRCLSRAIERQKVHNLQTGRTAGHKSDPGTDRHALRRSCNVEASDQPVRLAQIGAVQQIDDTLATRLTNQESSPRAIGDRHGLRADER